MSQIGSLLDEDTRLKLAALKAETATMDAEPAFIIIKAATDPNPPRPLTAADAIDIDPESGAMIDVECVDCSVPMLLDPELPEGADPEAPRVPMCKKCAKVRARFAAINEQRNVEIIHRRTVARQQPRTTDGVDHPVTVTIEKEQDMTYDLQQLSDAELGAAVRADLVTEAAKDIPEKRKKAKAETVKATAKAKEGTKARQAARRDAVLEPFMVGTLEVPALDLTDVEDLNEMVSTTLRSPYNKARFRLAGERPLFAPKDEDEDDYTPTTYQTLIDEHARLMALATVKAAEKAEPKEPKAKAAPQIVALLSDADEAGVTKKVKALRKLTGLDKATCRAIVLAG